MLTNMKFSITLPLFIFLLIAPFSYCSHGATIDIQNNCPFTVWAAAKPGGCRRLDNGQVWTIKVPAGTNGGRVWARTGCIFDGSGQVRCQTGNCNGLLECTTSGEPPNTLAEYGLNGFQNLDFFDISLVEGFNVPMEFSPTGGCTRGSRCVANITEECPGELRAPHGSNNPCTVFKTDPYCCPDPGNCQPTVLSRFFKQRCPDAYSYPMDDQTSAFTCPAGTNYTVVFCPSSSEEYAPVPNPYALSLVCGL